MNWKCSALYVWRITHYISRQPIRWFLSLPTGSAQCVSFKTEAVTIIDIFVCVIFFSSSVFIRFQIRQKNTCTSRFVCLLFLWIFRVGVRKPFTAAGCCLRCMINVACNVQSLHAPAGDKLWLLIKCVLLRLLSIKTIITIVVNWTFI